MPANFTQDEINLREVTDDVCGLPSQVAKNTRALLPLQAYAGKNLLINGDKSVSQRGDFSVQSQLSANEYAIDRFRALIISLFQTIDNGTFISTKWLPTAQITSKVGGLQPIEVIKSLRGKQITYSAWVKSNTPNAGLIVYNGTDFSENTKHSGSGEFELLSVVTTIANTANIIYAYGVITGNGWEDVLIEADHYIEVGNEQLDLGSEFTGFEIVSPAVQLANCQRYYQRFMTNTYLLKYSTIQAANMEVFTFPYPVTMRAVPVPTIVTQPVLTNSSTLAFQANEYQASLKSDVLAAGVHGVDNSGVYEVDSEL